MIALLISLGIVLLLVVVVVVVSMARRRAMERFEQQWKKMSPDEQRQWQYDHAGDSSRLG